MLSRNFCQEGVRENFRNFHTVDNENTNWRRKVPTIVAYTSMIFGNYPTGKYVVKSKNNANEYFYFSIFRTIYSDLKTLEVPLIVIHPFQPRFSNLPEPFWIMTNMYLWTKTTCYFVSACWKIQTTLKELLFIPVKKLKPCSIMEVLDINAGE